MRYKLSWFALLIVAGNSLAAIADTWKVERLAYNLDTAEGPLWDAAGKLYYTEIFANRVHEYTVASGEFRLVRLDSGGANGMAFDAAQRILMCEMLGKRVSRLEPDGTVATLWEAEHSGKGGPNDIVVSASGNIYFTMPRHSCIYRITPDGSVAPFVSDLAGVNGVMLSQDESTLYATEYKQRKVHAFPLNERTGTIGARRLFAQIQTEGTEHGADGMAVDDEDRLYVACLGGVWIYDPQGQQVGFIPLPGESVTNCAFGDTSNRLFITTQKGLFYADRLEE